MAASKNPAVRLLHIRDEIEGITAALAGKTLAQYLESYMLRRAVERGLQIISEAAKALLQELIAGYPDAPWTAIIGIGNVLRHEYQRIDDGRLWQTATVYVPQLKPVILRMIADLKS
jgi:uncharacterized protein with HEPN domain